MSDSNRTRIGFVKEALFNTVPANPAWKNLRVKGTGLSFVPKTTESKELRPDRMVADLIRIANEAGGPLPLEVSWRSLDDLVEYVMQSLWSRTPVRDNNGTASSVVTAVAAGTGVFTVTAAANPVTDYSSGAYVIGQLIRASGFGVAGNNGLFRVTTGGGTSVTCSPTTTGAEAAPAAAARLKVVGFQGVAADITATATGLGSTALNFTTLGLSVGQWISVGGLVAGEQFATAANKGWARITSIAATALGLDNLPAGWGVDAGAGKTITVYTGDYIRNGVVENTMSIEQQYQDLVAPEYDVYSGMAVDQLKLGMKANDIIAADVTFVGASVTNGTVRTAGSTDIAAATNDVLNTASNVGRVAENGTALTGVTAVTDLELTIMNAIRRRAAVGSLGSIDIASGAFRVKGKMSMYYASNAIRTKVLNGTASSIDTRIVDATAPFGQRAYVIDLPKIKFDDGNPNVPGIDSDRTMDPSFTAIAHPTFGYACSIQRVEEFAP